MLFQQGERQPDSTWMFSRPFAKRFHMPKFSLNMLTEKGHDIEFNASRHLYPFRFSMVFEYIVYAPSMMFEVTICCQTEEDKAVALKSLQNRPMTIDGNWWLNKEHLMDLSAEDWDATQQM